MDTIKEVNASPEMRVMLSGGIFDRAEGLWEEIGADLYALTPNEAVKIASAEAEDIPVPRKTIKQRRKTSTAEPEDTKVLN